MDDTMVAAMVKMVTALIEKAMLLTVYTLGEAGEIDKERALNWLDSHKIQIKQENDKYGVEIVEVE